MEKIPDTEDIFLLRLEQISTDDALCFLDAKLVPQKDAAARFYAISLALDPDTTDEEIYDALVEYDYHPEIVAVVADMGKTVAIETIGLIRKWRSANYNDALCRAAGEGRIETMKMLKKWGATDYTWALAAAAEEDRTDAMLLIKTWKPQSCNFALKCAAGKGHIEAMKLCRTWGATALSWALEAAAREGRVEAIELLSKWGVSDYSQALTAAAGNTKITNLLNESRSRWRWWCR